MINDFISSLLLLGIETKTNQITFTPYIQQARLNACHRAIIPYFHSAPFIYKKMRPISELIFRSHTLN